MNLVKKTVTKTIRNVDVATKLARDEMMASLIQISKEMVNTKRPKIKGPQGGKYYTPAISGFPPMKRTGDLQRSITGVRYREGFASYSATVGPTIEYGRVLELGGNPNWPAGTKFPYMEPSFQIFRVQVYPQIRAKYFGRMFK